jgi:hypothetical protein
MRCRAKAVAESSSLAEEWRGGSPCFARAWLIRLTITFEAGPAQAIDDAKSTTAQTTASATIHSLIVSLSFSGLRG